MHRLTGRILRVRLGLVGETGSSDPHCISDLPTESGAPASF
jgi:hypothetical protein